MSIDTLIRERQMVHTVSGPKVMHPISDDSHQEATILPFDIIEEIHKPFMLPDAIHVQPFPGIDLGNQSQPWEASSDRIEFMPSTLGDTGSSLNFHTSLALPQMDSEPCQDFTIPYVVSPSFPMDSYIRVRRYSFYAACFENALVLGVTFDKLKDHKCGHDRLISLWLRQPTNYLLNENAVSPDLAPGEAQKKHDHDLYIDCLPFKDFREKLLALRSVDHKIFDKSEFIHDLDYRDAMQCWGPTPWENKSWEVKIWFLKKWWMITGGEHGEMGISIKWWRQFRGELT
jgi:hypothetical protein